MENITSSEFEDVSIPLCNEVSYQIEKNVNMSNFDLSHLNV